MQACGIIVEYNPLHNGHLYHMQQTKLTSGADCLIAVMSGPFLQRGEPAIIDKFSRTKAALSSGIDLILELPYPYAVQSSGLFAKGAVHSLHALGVSSICFGSEQGNIKSFIKSYDILKKNKRTYKQLLKKQLAKGISFPKASEYAYRQIGFKTSQAVDLSQPNNILGYSYVKTILDDRLSIEPLTIQRKMSGYHEDTISHSIASATSIRKQLIKDQCITKEVEKAIPLQTIHALKQYRKEASLWHHWEQYFPYLQYKIHTMTSQGLRELHGVDEGLENRILRTVHEATSFKHWMELLKTKRYTWTRLQRMFVHILTHTKKEILQQIHEEETVPYVRLLGMTGRGRKYLRHRKKRLDIPLISQLNEIDHPWARLEEKASNIYYSVLPVERKKRLRKRDFSPLIILEKN